MVVNLFFKNLAGNIKSFWVNEFWTNPNKLWALKVMVCIALFLIPSVLLGKPFIGATLGMGVVAMALSETDIHPRGKLKAIFFTIISFLLVTVFVELLMPYSIVFGFSLAVFTFIVSILGGVNSRFQGIAFGSLLICVYAILGFEPTLEWYIQPSLMVLGAMLYGAVSLVVTYKKPLRLLDEQMSLGYSKVAEYLAMKANLFPSDLKKQEHIRNELSLKNIEVTQKIIQIRGDISNFALESSAESLSQLDVFKGQWVVLQEIQRRTTSTHEDYHILSQNTEDTPIINGIGQLIRELSKAIQLYADSILTKKPYIHPVSLSWTLEALKSVMDDHKDTPQFLAFSLLLKNLSELEALLKQLEQEPDESLSTYFKFSKTKPKIETLKSLFNPEHPRFRFAVRLTLCFVIGYALQFFLNVEKNGWILLTSLIVCQQTYSATRQRMFHRIAGTILGVLFGVTLAQLLPTNAGQILILLLSVYAFFRWVRVNYTLSVIFITIFVLESFNLQLGTGVIMMLPRLIDTLIGAGLAYLSVRFLWPDWQYKSLPERFRKAIEKDKAYFESVYLPQADFKNYLSIQQAANNADSQLGLSWQGMRLEPKNKQQFLKAAQNITYYNHALVSYISAFATHNYQKPLLEEELGYCKKISVLLDVIYTEILPDAGTLDTFSEDSRDLVRELREIKNTTQNRNMILIYNIAKVTNELLLEADGLKSDFRKN